MYDMPITKPNIPIVEKVSKQPISKTNLTKKFLTPYNGQIIANQKNNICAIPDSRKKLNRRGRKRIEYSLKLP